MARKVTVGFELYESTASRKVTILSNIFEETEAVAADVTVDVPVGSFAYAGLTPTIILDIDIAINVPVGSWAYAGIAPSVVLPIDFTPFINLPKNQNPSYRAGTGIQPIGQLEVDWSNPLTRSMVGVWLTNGMNRELVQNQPLPITGSDFVIKRDNKGSRVDFGNTQTTWFEVSLEKSQPYLIGTKDFSWAGLVEVQPTPSSEQTLFQIGRGQTGGKRFSIFLNTTEVWDGEIDDDVFRSDFNFISAPPLNERSVLLITADRDVEVVGYINGQIDGTADISGSQGPLDDADHGVHIGYNQELNVGSRDNIARSGFEMNVLWHRILSDVEVQSFSRDPYQILKPVSPTISFQAQPNVNVEVPIGSYVYSGLSPLLQNIIDIPTGSYRYNGLIPALDITNDIQLNIPAGAYSYSGLSPQVNTIIFIPTGSYIYSGLLPVVNITADIQIDIPTGAFRYNGLIPDLVFVERVNIPSGNYSYSGFQPTLDLNIVVPVGSYSYSGFDPLVITGDDVAINIPIGTYAYSGLDPILNISADVAINIPVGSYRYSGIVPNIDLPILINTPTGSIRYSGIVPNLIFENRLPIPSGSYGYSGIAPEIIIIAPDRTVNVPTGNFSYSGFSPVVVGEPVLIVVPAGSYIYTGLVPLTLTGEIAVTPDMRMFGVISENRTFIVSDPTRILEV